MMTRKEMAKEEVIAIVEKHEMWLTGDEKGERADFTDVIFPSDMTMENRNLRAAIFTNAELYDVTFRECNLRHANFAKAYMSNVEFAGCMMMKVNFPKADLRNVSFVETKMQYSDFHEAELESVLFDCVHANNSNFAEICIRNSDLLNCYLPDSDFRKAEISLSGIIRSCFTGGNLDDVVISGSKISFSSFVDRTDLNRIEIYDSFISSSTFWDSNLREAKFTECCIKYSEFTAAYLKNAKFCDCVVLAVDLTRSVLTNINAEGTTFVNTDFEDADLRDVGFLDSICR